MALIDRTAALALINQQNSDEIFEMAAQESVALAHLRKIPMSAKQRRMPILSALPSSGFIAADTGTKQTTQAQWTNKVIEAEEIACIVPIPEAVFDDSAFNVWESVKPRLAEAVGATLDKAVFFSTGKPASWPVGIFDGAVAAVNKYSIATAGDLAEDLNQTLALVEADGYDPDLIVAKRTMRASLRGLRDVNGQPIYASGLKGVEGAESVYGVETAWARNGMWVPPSGTFAVPVGAHALAVDTSQFILGLRQDMTFKILTEATLTNGAGVVTYSLAEQDMIALRVVFRVGFQVADPITLEGGAGGYPAAALVV